MTETPRPEFDPRRSDGFRSMLGEHVAQEAYRGASARRIPRRTTVMVALAVTVGVIASGTTALALTGSSLFGLHAPSVTHTPPTPTPSPSQTQTQTQTPPPAAPSVAPEPVEAPQRVPSTCDELMPQSAAESLAGVPLAAGWLGSSNPVSYSDRRVGSLSCYWTDSPTGYWQWDSTWVSLLIVPDVTEDSFQSEAGREGRFSPSPEEGVDSYALCAPFDATAPDNPCTFIARVGDYGILFTVSTSEMGDDARSEANVDFERIRAAVAAFAAPEPLWHPSGSAVTGAESCDTLIDPAELAIALGIEEVRVYKNEEGEYANAAFRSNTQVGAYWCSWSDAGTSSIGAAAAVLPGGAPYFAATAAADSRVTWTPAPDYPGEAYLGTAEGMTNDLLTILIDGAWVQVSAPPESLRTVALAVLTHVGAN